MGGVAGGSGGAGLGCKARDRRVWAWRRTDGSSSVLERRLELLMAASELHGVAELGCTGSTAVGQRRGGAEESEMGSD